MVHCRKRVPVDPHIGIHINSLNTLVILLCACGGSACVSACRCSRVYSVRARRPTQTHAPLPCHVALGAPPWCTPRRPAGARQTPRSPPSTMTSTEVSWYLQPHLYLTHSRCDYQTKWLSAIVKCFNSLISSSQAAVINPGFCETDLSDDNCLVRLSLSRDEMLQTNTGTLIIFR